MSLIDPKHLIGPFKNTIHIVVIVFVVLLFAVYRLATVGVNLDNPAEELRAAARGQIVEKQDKSVGMQPLHGTEFKAPQLPDGGTPTPSSEENSAGLQDIERALGLKQ